MLAQAELMAAHEEAIQNRQNPSTSGGNTRQPITSSFFASALQAARANLVSTSTQTTAGEYIVRQRQGKTHPIKEQFNFGITRQMP